MKTQKINPEKKKNTPEIKCDIVIVGAGTVGMVAALYARNKGFKTILIDPKMTTDTQQNTTTTIKDRRVVALTPATLAIFKTIRLYDTLEKYLSTVRAIHVDESRIGAPAQKNIPPLLSLPHQSDGQIPFYTIAIHTLNHTLRNTLVNTNNPDLKLLKTSVLSETSDNHAIYVHTDDTHTIKAKLLIAADGTHSPIRKRAHIAWRARDYNQSAITCTVNHDKSNNATATERFFPQGVCAALPVKDHHSAIVWCEETHKAHHIHNLEPKQFIHTLERRLKDKLGKITLPKNNKPQLWPIRLAIAQKIYAPRCSLIGNAAHMIHPLAGLGLNLGFGDIRDLMHILHERHELGLDIGSQIPLHEYQNKRMSDIFSVIFLTDGLHALFSNHNTPLRVMRKAGLQIINRIPIAKSFLMRQAVKI